MIKNFVTRPLFTFSIFIVLIIFGVLSYSRLPLDFLPNISLPTLTIITPYPGASADDIEITVSKVIEDSVATVTNIDKITSNSMENISIVTINFKWGSDIDAAAADVRDKMDLINAKLPKDVQPSTIYKFDTSQIPILIMGVSADQSYKGLYDLADKKITNLMKRVQGVGTVTILGGLQRQINVDVDRTRLEAYHLSIGQVNLALQAANLSMPAGSIKSTELEYGIRIPGEYSNMDEISKTVIGSYQGKSIFISDIARVTDSFKEPDNMTEVDQKPGIMLMVQKQSGANTVQVTQALRKEIVRMQDELPPDIKFSYVQDTSEYISRSINELTKTLYWSFLFVVLTVLFFLRNVRGSLIVSLAIPMSIIAAFIYMFYTGASINIISLASIIISIGVVVDDAIVVMENIYRHMEKKHEAPVEAAIYGGGEVSGAVIASTTTNLAIFIPLLLVQGFIGIFFNQLSIITIVVISMSLFTAMTLTPMLSSKLLEIKKEGENKKNFFSDIHDRSEEAFNFIEEQYKKILSWSLNNRKRVVIICSLIFFLSMPLFLVVGTEFFPDQDNGLATATVELAAGSKFERTAEIMRKIEAEVKRQVPELEFILITAGSSQRVSLTNDSGPNKGKIYLKLVPMDKRKRSLKEIQRQVAGIAMSIPGLKNITFAAAGANALGGANKPVTVEIYGNNFDVMDQVTSDLKQKFDRIPGIVDPSLSREKTNPEYALKIDREKASDFGLTMYDVAMAARQYIYGNTSTKYREQGDEYDIFVRLDEDSRKSIDDIKNVYVTNRMGQNISLGNIATVELRNGPQVIERKNQQRYERYEADYFGRPLGDIIRDVSRIISKTSIPADVTVKITGNAEQMAESFKSLFIALILGISLIYLVMVAQFESFLEPFIIMFAIPFALVGVVWALFLTGLPFGVMPFIGLIMVVGVAVKNSIVLVDYTNILRERGIEIKESILEAGKTRLRPILMTSCTAILGLLPIVFGTGEGSGFWKNMSIAVLGGLIVSATISLVFVPTFYFIVESRFKDKGAGGGK
ncbi:MAG: efflux RND transporter permease subunit [Candidatus Saganbacteria bacterium]|nr:efflux RND transporter permease subunit [Candidatus Saganbacteria bacterium]